MTLHTIQRAPALGRLLPGGLRRYFPTWDLELHNAILQFTSPRKRIIAVRLVAPEARVTLRSQGQTRYRVFVENAGPALTREGPAPDEAFGNTCLFRPELTAGQEWHVGYGYPGDEVRFAYIGDNQEHLAAYDRVLRDIAALDPAPDFVIHGGDLVLTGRRFEYEMVRRQMGWFPLPVYFVPGCHDVRGGGEPHWRSLLGPLSGWFECAGMRFVWFENASHPMRPHNWRTLEAVEREPSRPVLLFLHRPLDDPRPGHNHIMRDEKGRARLREFIERIKPVRVFHSHIHGHFEGVYGDVPFTVSGGGGADLQGHDRPHYLVVTCREGRVVVERREAG